MTLRPPRSTLTDTLLPYVKRLTGYVRSLLARKEQRCLGYILWTSDASRRDGLGQPFARLFGIALEQWGIDDPWCNRVDRNAVFRQLYGKATRDRKSTRLNSSH